MKKFKTITAAEIAEKELEEMPFVVDKLLPIGLSLLAGSPKVGKSYLSLWLSIKVGNGEPVWDCNSTKSTVLYLALEDNEIRIQNRLLEITENAPSNVHFCTEISKLGGELETRIKNFILENEDTKLIIIDTLQTIRPVNSESSYANDYSDLLSLKNLAYEYEIAILLIHHFRKQKDKDTFNQITGSTGLQGVVDTMFTLVKSGRGEKVAELNCIGRDIEPRELEVERTEDNDWILLSDSMSDINLADRNFVKTVQNLIADKQCFVGTPTELSSQLESYSDEKYSSKKVSRNIKRLSENLKKADVRSLFRRTGKARIIVLGKISDENDVKNLVSI